MYIYISKHRQKTLLFLADRPVLFRSGDQWLQPTNLHMTYSACLDSIRVRGNNQVLRKQQLGLPARSGGLWDGSGFRNQVSAKLLERRLGPLVDLFRHEYLPKVVVTAACRIQLEMQRHGSPSRADSCSTKSWKLRCWKLFGAFRAWGFKVPLRSPGEQASRLLGRSSSTPSRRTCHCSPSLLRSLRY